MHATSGIAEGVRRYPRHPTARYEYGTAGFRMSADLMAPIAFRVGLFLALHHAGEDDDGGAVGVMITASHNPEGDNGIKLVGPSGEMVGGDVEEGVSAVCLMGDEELIRWAEEKERSSKQVKRTVLIGMDTRPSGPLLFTALTAGLLDSNWIDCDLVTTPQLHHYVHTRNKQGWEAVGEAEQLYLAMLRDGYNSAVGMDEGKKKIVLFVDCANGVGALTMEKLGGLEGLDVRLVNTGKEGRLNEGCGADYVKMYQCAPVNIEKIDGAHYASFDGDADRVVLFHFDPSGKFHLLDGDRIAVLLAETFQLLLQDIPLVDGLRMGVVQTAYANGASTRYLEGMEGVEVRMVETGVKNLHKAAKEFDVGIYFEANGHGTVHFSSRLQKAIPAGSRLEKIMSMVNGCVGDAISDLLLVEAILRIRGLTLTSWTRMYTEIPSMQVKVPVPDRSLLQTTDADRRVVRPVGMQAEIERIVGGHGGARGFVRASGTEDVVRVYVEAGEGVGRLADALAALSRAFIA